MEKPKPRPPFWRRIAESVLSGVIIRAILAGLIWAVAWTVAKVARVME